MRCSRGISAAALALANVVSASLVHISAYTGNVTTYNLTATTSEISTQAALRSLDVSGGCGDYPSWLTLAGDILYCVNENWPDPKNGSLSSFRVGPEGQLTLLSNVTTLGGPVYAVIYGEGKGLAVADYGGGGINTFNISDPANITPVQAEVFTLTAPGANPQRQDIPHPHQTIVDPTGNFLVVPDLGADLVRVFALDNATLRYTQTTPLQAATPGAGPRHGTFVKGPSKTFFYLVHELANTLVGYEVTYNADGKTLGFKEVHSSNTHGESAVLPNTTAAAEVIASPCGKFLTVSSRFDGTLTVPNYDPSNSTAIPSDPLITFSIDLDTGALAHRQTRAAGGVNPRQFSFNRDGTLVGVGLQSDSRTVLIARDPETGLLGDIVEAVSVVGLPNCVIFDE
ncbi:Lactonase, 7-bladed beta-propeller-domain-containing protein [Echria macrotheca]|uniref:Lactonase, 7-bladed beta-propeller-domain-containing protein n=1 Tax=Echria macrotheca TaxID=438768 RepID=A0AAJ0BJD2_9PEZI|nr:Lactonase, 7-bladed beta-propeller-domain-containing protein [Echria macrotheca]